MPTSPQLSSESIDSVVELRARERERLFYSLRTGQQRLAEWQGGALAVSAVPGAGKSTGMAVAAALTIAREGLHSRRYLVVVTFTRSAAANIKAKIRQYLRGLYLPPTGFVVNTLHGLALNIASRHPDLSGLNLEALTVISPDRNHRLIRSCVEQWISLHPRLYHELLEGKEFDGEDTERIRRQSVLRTEVLPDIVKTVIHEAKSSGLLPQDLWDLSHQSRDNYQILAIAAGLYEQYQQLLQQRQSIDYDDMILAALRALENDSIRRLWQEQVFAVFEDEAQDSTPLQTKLLEILARDPDTSQLNLVRVGDPNQAINSTFTPADPIYFRKFCQSCALDSQLATMDRAGRSSGIIIDAANFVLDWVSKSKLAGNEEPFSYQFIKPVDANDPQPNANPQPTSKGLEIHTPIDVYQSVELIGNRIVELFGQNPDANAAVLVRENRQGTFVAQQLSYLRTLKPRIEVYDVAQSDRYSLIPGEILNLLQFASRPHSPNNLKAALEALVQRKLIPSQDLNALSTLPEKFLYPGPLDPQPSATVLAARDVCRRLLDARLQLPSYQLIPFIAAEILNYEKTELATADKLGERIAQQTRGNTSLNKIIAVLSEIVTSESFEAVDTEEPESRYLRPRQLTIITMHKAKGLDWDYVFIPFLHQDNIPGSPWVPNAAKFLGDFTLSEVARAQIRTRLHGDELLPEPQLAWQQATNLKTAEEYRLLYVAMTRAKSLLWLSAALKGPFRWSAFDWERGVKLQEKIPCPVIPVLQKRFYQAQQDADSQVNF